MLTVLLYYYNLCCQRSAASNVEFAVAHTGVYLVKVGNASAKRVLVVR